jgi:hypothetical protein
VIYVRKNTATSLWVYNLTGVARVVDAALLWSQRAQAMEFEVLSPEVVAGLRARDEAAKFKCAGGEF